MATIKKQYMSKINSQKFKPLQKNTDFYQALRYKLAGLGIPITKNEKKLLALKNIHSSERIFIICNGPSLNMCNLKLLKNEITIGMNSIFLNYENMGFHPTYYIVEDVLVAEDRAQEIKNYQGPRHKFFGNYLSHYLEEDVSNIWLNVIIRHYLEQDKEHFPNFSTNLANKVWVGGTVTYLCLQLAYYLGTKQVYLIGCDHSYKIPNSVIKDGLRLTSTEKDPNHFHPDYFGKGFRWHDPNTDRMEKAYKRAKEFFEKDGKMIYNATIGGKLEVFQRVNYEALFN